MIFLNESRAEFQIHGPMEATGWDEMTQRPCLERGEEG